MLLSLGCFALMEGENEEREREREGDRERERERWGIETESESRVMGMDRRTGRMKRQGDREDGWIERGREGLFISCVARRRGRQCGETGYNIRGESKWKSSAERERSVKKQSETGRVERTRRGGRGRNKEEDMERWKVDGRRGGVRLWRDIVRQKDRWKERERKRKE